MSVRFDRVEVPDWIGSKFETTPEGYLVGRAACTNIGVFTYRYADGTIVRELRTPDEVFSPDSMASIKNIPLTLEHPQDTLHPTDGVIGKAGENPLNGNNIYLSVDLTITDKDAIEEIKNGKQFLSCGYEADIVFESGRYLGMEYDAVQKNIRYGHIAVVDSPRAGETARIRLDANDAVLVDSADSIDKDVKEDIMADANQTIPVEVKVDTDDVKQAVKSAVAEIKTDELQAQIDSLAKEKTQLEAERDTLKDRVDALEKKITELDTVKMDEAAIKAAVERRVRILDAARQAEVEVKEDMSETDIQKAVIAKVFPKANLADKDQVYIDARFDGAVESLADNADAAMRQVNSDVPVVNSDADVIVDSGKAREKFIENLTRAKK